MSDALKKAMEAIETVRAELLTDATYKIDTTVRRARSDLFYVELALQSLAAYGSAQRTLDTVLDKTNKALISSILRNEGFY